MTPRLTTSAALMSPTIPAADSRWPTLVFTEPMSSGRRESRPWPVDAVDGVQLDRVADRGSRSVRLNVVHLQRIHAGLAERVLHDLLQGGRVGDRQPYAGPPVVDHRAPNHRPDPVAVRLGVAQALEHHHAAPLGPHIAVGGGIERLALPFGRQHHRVGAQLVDAPVQDRLHATREGEVRPALLQVGDRVVHRHHRRSARGVHRLGRTGQTEHEGHAPGGAVQVGAAEGVETRGGLGGLGRIHHQHAVFVVADPGIDSGAALLQPIRIDARVFERLPAHLQHHALLRIQQLGLDGRNPEEGVVELVDFVYERAEATGLAPDRTVPEDLAPAPHPRPRNSFGDRVAPGFQHAPEGLDVVRPGEAAGHADDRDRLCGCGRGTSGGGA